MLGIGKWKFNVDVFLFKGYIILNVTEKDGEYSFEPSLEGFNDDLNYEILDVKVKGNTLIGTARATLMPGNKVVVATLEFKDDCCYGVVDLPYYGRLNLGKGEKIG